MLVTPMVEEWIKAGGRPETRNFDEHYRQLSERYLADLRRPDAVAAEIVRRQMDESKAVLRQRPRSRCACTCSTSRTRCSAAGTCAMGRSTRATRRRRGRQRLRCRPRPRAPHDLPCVRRASASRPAYVVYPTTSSRPVTAPPASDYKEAERPSRRSESSHTRGR